MRCSCSVFRASSRAIAVPRPQQRAQQVAERPARQVLARFWKLGGVSGSDEAYPLHDSRESYSANEVRDYFEYQGVLAVEGSYDRMDELMAMGHDPVDVLLLLAASENDDSKVEEVLRCGADAGVRDAAGRTPRELATKASVVQLLAEAEAKRSVAA
ncbi:hypothetical protein Rsub_00953 [Raphidocelis subcapitata]|uniref:Uncharacterized protein n=1 Tax=Raphidocelis subcapitata TaxID=307507 RepID=A0A2V0NLG1_9CHLO|nr:hypothetical protein Rsub_00953 [Raphidocelis subcapitata]|eukprot:GBF88241.1 hypothetical protein Rsub_00953 [Raphidocelis subcapitata]